MAIEGRSLCSFSWPRKYLFKSPPNQVADIFTKSVSRPLFEFFRFKLHVRSFKSDAQVARRGGGSLRIFSTEL